VAKGRKKCTTYTEQRGLLTKAAVLEEIKRLRAQAPEAK